MRFSLLCSFSLALSVGAPALAQVAAPPLSPVPDIAQRQKAQRKTFTDAEIAAGFFKVTFGAELAVEGRTDRIRKYDKPVRVHIDNRSPPDRRAALNAVVGDIAARIANIDIAVTANADAANVKIVVVRDRDLLRTIGQVFGRERMRSIQQSLEPQCLSGFRKDESYRIEKSDIVLAGDVDDFTFLDCAYEELLQSLGPINDTDDIPWTMFNDDVQMGFFDIYDQIILNVLYDPRVQPGMTAAQARAVLPEAIAAARAFVNTKNGIAP